jgi:hypothetical protein
MKVRVQVIVESESGETQCVEDVAQFERGELRPEALELMLAEAKALLQGVQRTMVAEQTTAYLDAHRPCPACGTPRRCKGHHQLIYRTVQVVSRRMVKQQQMRWTPRGAHFLL